MRVLTLLMTCYLFLALDGICQTNDGKVKPMLVIDPQGHSAPVNGLQFTPDGLTLISVSGDKTIRFWDVKNGYLNRTLHIESGVGPEGAIYTAALSSDGQYLAIGGYFPENEIRIINIKRDQDITILKGHSNTITKLSFSKNGKLLASASSDNTIKVWQMTFDKGTINGALLQTLSGHQDQVYDISFSPDAKKIVSASADGSLRLWNITGQGEPVLMRMHVDKVYSCAFSKTGEYIVSGGNKGKILLWNSDGTFKSILGTMDEAVAQLNFTDDGKLFASAKAINAYSVPSGTLLGIIPQQDKNVNASAIYGNQYFASSASSTGDIIIRDLQNQSVVSKISGNGVMPVEVAANGKSALAFGVEPRSLNYAFDLAEVKFLFSNFNKQEFDGAVVTDGGYSLKKIDDYTLSTGFKGTVKNDPGLDGRILRYTIIDASKIAVGSDFSIKLYSRDGDLIRSLNGANGAVSAMVVDKNTNYLYTATSDQTLRIWNIESGENLATIFISKSNDWICWTPSGYYDASAGGEKYLGWQVNKGASKLATFYPANVFAKFYHQPDMVKQTLRLGAEKDAIGYLDVNSEGPSEEEVNVSQSAPEIEWISPEMLESTADAGRVILKARIRSNSKIGSVKILINGRPAPQSRGISTAPLNQMIVEQEIVLLNEINKIKIFVSNEFARTVSEERIITLPLDLLNNQKSSNTQVIDYTAKPDLYVLGVGVSDYANKNYNLTYADDDATAITKLFTTTGKGAYKQVFNEQITNENATRQGILNSFAWLQQNATGRDVVLVFIASHGFNKDGEFYILPYDGDADRLLETAISWNNISNTLGNIPAKVLLMIDACHSGQLGANMEEGESNNTEAVRDISDDEKGVVIMAASTGDETSQEFEGWGHGAFTLSVLEGLEQGKADIKGDLTIFLRELDFYVSERTLELTNGQQHPTTQKPSSISRFPIIIIDK